MILVIVILVQDYGDKMNNIYLSPKIIAQFCNHGEAEYPHECCGFILGNFEGDSSYGFEYILASNTKTENRERRLNLILYLNKEWNDEWNGLDEEKQGN